MRDDANNLPCTIALLRCYRTTGETVVQIAARVMSSIRTGDICHHWYGNGEGFSSGWILYERYSDSARETNRVAQRTVRRLLISVRRMVLRDFNGISGQDCYICFLIRSNRRPLRCTTLSYTDVQLDITLLDDVQCCCQVFFPAMKYCHTGANTSHVAVFSLAPDGYDCAEDARVQCMGVILATGSGESDQKCSSENGSPDE